MNSFVGKRTLMVAALSGLALLGACKDKRIKEVNSGITRDSLLTVIGKGAPGVDSVPNVYRTERYLVDGKNWEVFFFAPGGAHLRPATKDTIPWKDLTPIVMVDRVVLGKDWPFWDSVATAHKFAKHPH